MKISVFGLGYVGCVSAASLASDGHTVIGVDVNPKKVETIQAGKSPIVEPGLTDLIKTAVKNKQLQATTDIGMAINKTDLSLICVGTPSQDNGALELRYVRRVCEQIGAEIKHKQDYHIVVVRSTVLPGTTEQLVIPTLEEASGKKTGEDFGVAFNPEFLREGSAIYDFHHPPRTVIGEFDKESGDRLAEIYAKLDAPLIRTSLGVSETVKYADNAFHALKVVFANEIGTFCKAHHIDSHQVMDIFVQDHKLNLSPYYLKPGPAFGGSCLPKDVRALLHSIKQKDVQAPVLEAILPSNEIQKQRALQLIMEIGNKNIGLLGLNFKENTDDLRESPTVQLAESLIGKGYEIKIYDPELQISSLIGANRAFLQNHLPHLKKLLVPKIDDIFSSSKTIVITTPNSDFRKITHLLKPDHDLVDLVRLWKEPVIHTSGKYYGIAW